MKVFMKKYWRELLGWVVILTAVFFILAFAPLGFLFSDAIWNSITKIIAVFLSAFLILYFLKK